MRDCIGSRQQDLEVEHAAANVSRKAEDAYRRYSCLSHSIYPRIPSFLYLLLTLHGTLETVAGYASTLISPAIKEKAWRVTFNVER
jgi:hypothetical protein